MVNDTQPPLPHHHYSQPAPALTTVHQPDISVHQLVAGLHQQSAATDVQQQSATDMHQLSANIGVQQQSAVVYTQPSAIQSACTQSSTCLLYTSPSPRD